MNAATPAPQEDAGAPAPPSRIAFADIEGWAADDHAAAFAAFRLSAARLLSGEAPGRGSRAEGLAGIARAALALSEPSPKRVQAFFEEHFIPHRFAAPGLLTGYYEPVVEARLEPSAEFSVPLYAPPAGASADENPQADICAPDRPAIEAGALAGMGLELAWLADPVDAFFIHVQGSARLRLEDGREIRLAYAGKSGHPYTSIGRLALERGHLAPGRADKAALEAFLKADRARGAALMCENRSFIFFRILTDLDPSAGPIGAAGVPLTPGRSIAVDTGHVGLDLPVWLEAPALPGLGSRPLRRLMVAQDVGSAIKGQGRADIFVGSGEQAGIAAGRICESGRMTVLLPRARH
ncbi:murein transglycosylase A [Afifella sp. IM 167]|uniref:murein transglycosylase A n=1 Tax=Afifella sp. IM 167 TaxID=2033586 RepID=UPI001CCA43BD|nr:MltA domain-containing protein [Afifella sp. IM 167]MBZ8133537.1 murein transglycosylase [Afifella sp. IM 167]